MTDKYNTQEIEEKWRKYWEKHPELFVAENDSKAEKKYILDMFPYPSGDGLHVGHIEGYTATDIYSRYMRMRGFNILHPMGWDAFGLPAENYAIKTKTHPSVTTKNAITNFKHQMNMMGFSYDWSREVSSIDPEYYKWTQWFFLLLYKNNLAYRAKAKVNWCEACKTVLANEQVINGECERCGGKVTQKDLEQWFFRITDFIEDRPRTNTDGTRTNADKYTSGLINGLDKIDWPGSTVAAQKNWIGRSEGAEIEFRIKNYELGIRVYTTRLDTIYGCTYLVIAPEHKLIQELKDKIENWNEIENYIKATKKKTDLDRMENKDKTGVEVKGIKIINPFTKEELPLYVADYVLVQYGTGAVMAVPAHDERDWEFAKKYDLPIRQSIAPLNLETGKDAPRDDKTLVRRKAVIVIIKHWERDDILCLDWEKFDWKSFVIGGVEDGETSEEAAIREAKEETGYQDIKTITKVGGEIHSHFFAVHKDVNRYAAFDCYFIGLGSDKYIEPKEKDVKNHKSVWVSKKEVSAFINLKNHSWYWDTFIKGEKATTEDGIVINSGEYSDMISEEAREKMAEWLEKNNLGNRKINYKIRDWLVSRQRYWGAPIPIIYCEKCGEVPVPEKDLPVELPDDVDFKPTGESPLKYSEKFQNVKCPKCGAKAKRESDTMDTFVCSSWYYFRYADPKNGKVFADKKLIKKWLPVDLYVGGAEHTVLHLLYSRFFTKVLHNLGIIDFDEPFLKLRHQGIILSPDGRKMSKSLGNVINPDDEVKKFGADALRLFEMFMGPLEDMKPWQTNGLVGTYRFLEKIWRVQYKLSSSKYQVSDKNKKIESLFHKTIKKVSADIEDLRFNTAISALMILANALEREKEVYMIHYTLYLILLSPFAPFISEELWNKLGHKESIFKEKWPEYDKNLIRDEEIQLVIQINGKVRDRIMASADISEEDAKKAAMESEKIKNTVGDKEIKKIIFVKGRLINIVI